MNARLLFGFGTAGTRVLKSLGALAQQAPSRPPLIPQTSVPPTEMEA